MKSLDDLASREETSAKESKLAALKIDLAQKSNKVSELESQLDKVPSSYELNQYQVLSVLYSSNKRPDHGQLCLSNNFPTL